MLVHNVEVTLDKFGDLPAVPFLAVSDGQAVLDAIKHVNLLTDGYGVGVLRVRVCTMRLGPIGFNGLEDVIEAPIEVILYEWKAGQTIPETCIQSAGNIVPMTPSTSVCPECNEICELVSSDGSPICNRCD